MSVELYLNTMDLFWEATRLTSSMALAMSTAGAEGCKEWRRRFCDFVRSCFISDSSKYRLT